MSGVEVKLIEPHRKTLYKIEHGKQTIYYFGMNEIDVGNIATFVINSRAKPLRFGGGLGAKTSIVGEYFVKDGYSSFEGTLFNEFLRSHQLYEILEQSNQDVILKGFITPKPICCIENVSNGNSKQYTLVYDALQGRLISVLDALFNPILYFTLNKRLEILRSHLITKYNFWLDSDRGYKSNGKNVMILPNRNLALIDV